jgi:hypothetical protein
MIKVVEKKNKKARDPYYKLKFNYMIGDADGNTSEEMSVRVGVLDDVIERFVKLINSLEPTKGHWGVMLSGDRIYEHFQENQITEDDYNFLKTVMFEYWDEDEEEDGEETDNKYKEYESFFADCIQAEAEYSFLVFEGVDLYYYDENGVKHDTKFV